MAISKDLFINKDLAQTFFLSQNQIVLDVITIRYMSYIKCY